MGRAIRKCIGNASTRVLVQLQNPTDITGENWCVGLGSSFESYLSLGEVRLLDVERSLFNMKSQVSALGILVLTLGAIAMQSCEFTDGQNSYYNRGRYGYYNDGRYAQDNGYYYTRRYAPDNGYYNEDRPRIDLHF